MAALSKFVSPSKDWLVRVYVVFIFIILDYAMTSLYCKTFGDEANLLLRRFMIFFDSVPLGLLVFMLLFYGPVYVLLCYFTNYNWEKFREINLVELLSEHIRPLFDIALGLGVASRHFEGAMSWILPLSNRFWLALGFIFYLTLVHLGNMKVYMGS